MSTATRQKRYRENHRDEINRRERERRDTPEHKAAAKRWRTGHRNAVNNRLGWRWLRWSARRARMQTEYGSTSVVSLNELENPSFRVVGCGLFRTERLFDPLPGAHPICANLPMSAGVENALP